MGRCKQMICANRAVSLCVTMVLGAVMAVPFAASVEAARYNPDSRDEPRKATILSAEPVGLDALQEVKKTEPLSKNRTKDEDSALDDAVKEEKDMALKIRRDAMREAALSFGARGGLAYRTKKIMDSLVTVEGAMDKAFNFRRLLIKAPSNMYIEPPIVSEALNNFIVTNNGEEAAVADTVYQISRSARIVSAPRNWRQYLERTWKEVLPPPDILLPENDAERKAWRIWVARGWREGYQQADEIFQADVDRLTADFEGMVRYRILLTQNKISAPYATMVDRGVSGNEVEVMVGNKPTTITTEMRVGDRAIRITAPSTLRPHNQGEAWTPPMQVGQ